MIIQTGQSSPFTFMCSRIRSQVVRYFPWLTPWNRLKHFSFPAEMKGIVCDGEGAAARLPKGRGRSWLQRHSLCTSVLPLCRGCVDLLSDVLTWRAASIWSGAWLAGCYAYRNHICIPASPATTERNSKGAGTNMKDHGNPFLVWSGFWVVSLLQGEFHPVWPILLLPYASGISRCFVEDGASRFIMRDSVKEAVASPVSPRKEYLGALFLSVQIPSSLFAPRQHFLWNQTTGSCPKFYQMITSWKPNCDCMSWASSRRFFEMEGSSWWHNSNYSSFFPLLK